jgi:hypothetical protein
LLRASPRRSFHEQPNWLAVPGCYHCHFLFWICNAVIIALSHSLDMGCQCTRPRVNCFAAPAHSELSVPRFTELAGRARSCKSVASAGADAARLQIAEREAGVLDGDRHPFRIPAGRFCEGGGLVVAAHEEMRSRAPTATAKCLSPFILSQVAKFAKSEDLASLNAQPCYSPPLPLKRLRSKCWWPLMNGGAPGRRGNA